MKEQYYAFRNGLEKF